MKFYIALILFIFASATGEAQIFYDVKANNGTGAIFWPSVQTPTYTPPGSSSVYTFGSDLTLQLNLTTSTNGAVSILSPLNSGQHIELWMGRNGSDLAFLGFSYQGSASADYAYLGASGSPTIRVYGTGDVALQGGADNGNGLSTTGSIAATSYIGSISTTAPGTIIQGMAPNLSSGNRVESWLGKNSSDLTFLGFSYQGSASTDFAYLGASGSPAIRVYGTGDVALQGGADNGNGLSTSGSIAASSYIGSISTTTPGTITQAMAPNLTSGNRVEAWLGKNSSNLNFLGFSYQGSSSTNYSYWGTNGSSTIRVYGTGDVAINGGADNGYNLDANGTFNANSINVSTGNLTFATAGRGIVGGSTSTTPSAGNVGSVAIFTTTSGSPVSLTNATPTNICSSGTLAAGHYLAIFQPNISLSSVTMVAASPMQAGINTTSATLPSTALQGTIPLVITLGSSTISVPLSSQYINLTSSGTIYGIEEATFSAGTASGYGTLTILQMP